MTAITAQPRISRAMKLQVEAGTEHHPGRDRPGDSCQLEGATHDCVVAPAQMIWRQVVGDRRDGRLEQRLAQRKDGAAADDQGGCRRAGRKQTGKACHQPGQRPQHRQDEDHPGSATAFDALQNQQLKKDDGRRVGCEGIGDGPGRYLPDQTGIRGKAGL